MEDNPTQSPGAPGVQTSDEKTAENHYELNLDEHEPADIDEAFKDAVAVDRAKETGTRKDPEGGTPGNRTPEGVSAKSSARAVDASSRKAMESETAGLRERFDANSGGLRQLRKRAEREKAGTPSLRQLRRLQRLSGSPRQPGASDGLLG